MTFLSFLAVIAGALGATGAYYRLLSPSFAFYLCFGAIAVIALNLPLNIVKFVRRGRRGVSLPALLFGLIASAALGLVLKFVIENPVTDVTNRPGNPPVFRRKVTSIPARGMEEFLDSSFLLNRDYNPDFAERQKRSYPGLHPLFVGAGVADTLLVVKEVLARHPEWRHVHFDEATNSLEIEEELPYLHAVDDFLIEVAPHEGGSIVLLRSRSRFGFTDFGLNAKRIRRFTEEFMATAQAKTPPLTVEARQ